MVHVKQGFRNSSSIYLSHNGQRINMFHIPMRRQGLTSSSPLYQVQEHSTTVSAVKLFLLDFSNFIPKILLRSQIMVFSLFSWSRIMKI